MPGYTHLQRAQPVTFAHWCLAYVEMLARDESRLQDTLKRLDVSPLGCGALAGTAYDIDREQLADWLGFVDDGKLAFIAPMAALQQAEAELNAGHFARARQQLAAVYVTITTLDPQLARILEPRAAAPHRRPYRRRRAAYSHRRCRRGDRAASRHRSGASRAAWPSPEYGRCE